MQAALWASPQPGDYVLDVCAAPGGKSLHMAELMLEAKNQTDVPDAFSQGDALQEESGTAKKRKNGMEMHGGMVEARDLTEYKVSLIEENIKRCGLPNIRVRQADARILDESQVEQADIVLADLPCSGLGVLGRKADIKYRMTWESSQELAKLQREILHTVQQYVKPGGILIYSTCTINPAENEENVSWFLQEHSGFQLERQRQILPCKGGNDGFFLAKLRKG